MRTSTRRHLAFALGLSAVVAMSGFLLNAAPPQAVGTWEVLGTTDPSSARSGAATATLEDDTTMIAGGRMLDGTITDSVLIYDPTTNASTVIGQLASPRVNAAAARLDDGRVLIVGGEIADLLSADAEIFDPATGTSIVVANMAAPRTRHAATRLADGKVLIVGGVTLEGVTLATAEVFDPETGSILEADSMATPRAGASATLLIDNRVLVAGGNNGTQDLASAELFYPATQEFFPVDTPLSKARAGHTAVLLPHNGAVLIAGGTAAGAPVTDVDLFLPTMFPDPYTWSMGTFGPAAPMTHARNQAVSGPMGDDGYAFVAGGGAAEGEAYAFVTIKTDKDDYEPGEFALITGTGWQPGEEVELVFQEDPAVHPDYTLTLTANGDGEIYHDDWAPEEHDLNVRFYLMATGAQSHRRAQMTFTDARNLSLTFAGGGSGSVTLTPSTGTVNAPTSCGGTGAAAASQTVTGTCSPNITTSDNGATVTFTATAAGGSVFAGWSLPNNFNSSTCSGTTSPCSATLGSNPAITVTFNLNANTTTTVASSLNPSTYGSSVTFTASVKVGATAVTAGSVTFIEGGTCALPATTLAGPVPLNVSGQAAFSTATLTVPSHTITACYGGAAGFNSSNGNVTQTVNKANAVVVVTPYTVTYDGLSHSATVVSITGVLGQTGATVGTVVLTNTTHTNAGIYNTDNWTFTGTANYNNITATTITDTINKANATVLVTPYTVTYDGQPHTAAASITGVNGEVGATVGTVDLTNTTHTNAGIYNADTWSFTGTANYNSIAATTITDTINKANAVVVVTPYTVPYDGQPHSATVVSITGVNSETGATVGTVDVSNTTHINAGVYNADSWSFTGTANYNNIAATTITDTINKANATVVVTSYAVTYDGQPHTAMASITGVNGETGATVGMVDLTNTTHTNAGIYSTDTWSFTGTANYNNIAATTITDTINKADATVVVTPYSVTYDGQSHTATASVTGVNAETGATVGTVDLTNTTHTNAGIYSTDAWSFTGTANYNDIAATTITDTINKADATVVVTPYVVTYDGEPHTATVTSITGVNSETGATVGTVDVSNTTHTNAGTYATDFWTFTGTANYKDIAATTITDTINKADATVVVTGYTGVYDAAAHGATGTATGVGGVDLSAGLNLGATFTNVPGGTAHWTFDGDPNYNDQEGDVAITINKADAAVVVTPYTVTYDAQPHTATASVSGVNGETGVTVGTVNLTNTTHTNAGVYAADTWSFTGTANYNDIAATTITDTINKADALVTVNGYTGVYDAAAHGATGTATGVGGVDLSAGLNLGATFTNVPGGTANWTFSGGTNYNDQSGTAAIVINKADALVTVNGFTGVYDAAAHGATGTATGVGGVDLSAGLNLGATFTNVPGGTANWTFSGGTNYNDQSGTAAIVINKADALVTVNGYTGVYDAAAHGATGTATGVGGVDLSAGLNLGATVTNVPGGTANWTFSGGTNYNDQSGTAAIVINKADALVTVNGYTGVYDTQAHGATGTATGVGGVDLSAGLNLGATFTNVPGGTANWTFSGGTNYNDQSGTAAIVINKADATVVVNGYTGVYDAAAHGATGTATGVGGVDLSAGLNLGATFTNVPGGTANWTFSGGTNYNDQSGTAAIVINKADATVVVNGYTGVYDAAAHGATGTATGVGGVDLSAGLNLGATFTNVPGGTANWTFSGGTNYNDQSGTAAIVINKADALVTVNGFTGVYDAAAHGATGTATGVGGVDLSAGLNLGATFTNVPGGTANWTFSGGTNYNDQSGTAAIVINKADAMVVVSGYTGVYDAAAHGATGTATGVGGVDLGAGLNLGATFTNVPGGTANWTFSGGTNYNDQSGTAAIVINKADALVTVNGYTGVYDTQAHGATGTATGVGGVDLSAGLNLGATFTNVPGGTANWTFSGGTNYNDQSGTAAIVINKADALVTVNGFTGVYDAAAHGATGTATGVGGVDLSAGLNLGATFTNVPGGTANWTFSGGTNYNDQSGTAAIVINKADATVVVNGYTGVYDAAAHGATGTATGVGGVDLSAGLNLGATFTNVPGGTANWTFSGGTNYNDQSGTAAIVINKAGSVTVVTIGAGPFVYNGSPHTPATVSVSGIGGLNLTPMATYANNVNAGAATASYTFAGDTNHTGSTDFANFTIDPKPAMWTTNPASKIYGNADPVPLTTGNGTGFLAADGVTATYSRAAGQTVAGSPYHITATLSATGLLSNYAITNAGANFTINPKPLTVTANSFSKLLGATYTFLGNEFGTSAMVAGDSVTSVTLASAGAAAGATVAAPGPNYAIVPSLAVGTGLSNYAISYLNGTLTVVYPTTGVCFGSPGHQVLQPLNTDGSSVVKKGSTVPVKFRVCDVNGNSIGTPGVVSAFQLVQVINGLVTTVINEDPVSTTPDAEFRWSASDKQWIFNLNTKNLSNGRTYVYKITLNDLSTIDFQFGTKQ